MGKDRRQIKRSSAPTTRATRATRAKRPTRATRAFRTSQEFRSWLEENHAAETELWIRLYKVHARAKGIGYREALDESLCFGWIDGVRRSLDADSFVQRFTPRKPKSNWSATNLKRVKELEAEGRMHAAGRAALSRYDGKPAPYSFEAGPRELAAEFVERLEADREAWAFWGSQPPGYRRTASFWVMSAKRAETRESRFKVLLRRARAGKRIPLLER